MFEVVLTMLSDLINVFPILFMLYVIFDLVGGLLFGKR